MSKKNQPVYHLRTIRVLKEKQDQDGGDPVLITYGDLDDAIGFTTRIGGPGKGRGIGGMLEVLRTYCMEKRIPLLNMLVVSAVNQKPGSGALPDGRIPTESELKNFQAEAVLYLRALTSEELDSLLKDVEEYLAALN